MATVAMDTSVYQSCSSESSDNDDKSSDDIDDDDDDDDDADDEEEDETETQWATAEHAPAWQHPNDTCPLTGTLSLLSSVG